MTILLAAAAFAASCIWLTVRIINRRERWARWTLAVLVGLPVLYVASFGPANARIGPRGLIHRAEEDRLLYAYETIYRPIFWAMHESPLFLGAMDRYCSIWTRGQL
jgi:hypothetical protein